MASEPKRRVVLKRIEVPAAEIAKDRKLKAAVDAWWKLATAFDVARKASKEAKQALQAILGPKLDYDDTVNWDVRKDPAEEGGIIAEVVEGEKGRRSQIETERASF